MISGSVAIARALLRVVHRVVERVAQRGAHAAPAPLVGHALRVATLALGGAPLVALADLLVGGLHEPSTARRIWVRK
jgi:hypothetical protein